MNKPQEDEIIRRVRAGDTDAFGLLVDEYQKNVYNLALRMTGSPEDAQDMSQEAFIKAYNSLSSFRGESKFSVWLYRIVSNVCLDFLRSRSKNQAMSLNVELDDGETELDIPDLRCLPEDELERALTRQAVRDGLEALPADQRQILLLREIEGFSYEEICRILALEEGTVKSRIFRARKNLCARLLSGGNIPEKYASEEQKKVKA
jgi:RNA polymerase sigma factor (sigma-70 family)